MATWEVLKASNEHELDEGRFDYFGTHDTEQSFSLGWEAPQQIGTKYGPGEYLLLNDENQRFERLTIGVRNEYYEITDPDPDPLTAAQVMEREG